MKRISSFVALACLISACSQQPEMAKDSATNDSLSRVENGLRKAVLINGQKEHLYDISSRLEHYKIPGVSISVAYEDKILWSKAYGMADIAKSQEMSTDTMLLAGSISKPVAALRGLQLHEEGKLLLDEDINTYLTSWQVPENEFTKTEKVTLRRILNHSAGLTVWGFPGYDKGDDIPSTVEVLNGKGNTDQVRVYKTPGKGWQYSGGGYTIMQLAIADLEQVPFAESLQTHVLDPMNMTDSTFVNPLPKKYHSLAATGYRRSGEEVEGKWPIYPEMAAAGLWTTPEQLVQYGIEIQRIVETKQKGVIAYDTALEMLTSGDNDHGLGPTVVEEMFSHGGADEGFRAKLVAWRNQPYVVVVMVNSDNGAIINEVLRAITAEYGLPGYDVLKKTVFDLPQASLEKFVGQYDAGDEGVFNISMTDKGLQFHVVDFDYTSALLPQSENVLFESRNGIEMRFVMDGEKATQLSWRGFTANRI